MLLAGPLGFATLEENLTYFFLFFSLSGIKSSPAQKRAGARGGVCP
jgi:hypothetical protein